MRYKILIVDDDVLCLMSLKLLLEQSGYAVETAESGEAAEKLVKASPEGFSLVLLDYQMGSKDGAATVRDLLSVCPNMYVLIYSGDSSREAVKKTWEAGAAGFIEKGGSAIEL